MVSAERLLTLMKSNVTRKIPTLIFCNESSTACFLGYFLESNNIPNVVLHANMPEVVSYDIFTFCELFQKICLTVVMKFSFKTDY